ncbi:major facilitator superfamily domain-containing protein 4A [Chaetodon trifascialis]|uniref:major facilitator superfamily domain-containing protein 4A n=1 Tax=Chaetodon trifascialis TaxID=109706 RepID=UPI003993D191
MKLVDERIWLLFKRRCQQTLTYWSVFFSSGLCIAVLGPTILDLRCQTHSTLQQITWVFFSQQFFMLAGCSLGGIFKQTLRSSLAALLFCTLTISLVFAIIPLCSNIALLSIAMAFAGSAMGVIETIANLQLVKLYQKDSAIFLQALHFFTGLGALISPLVVNPFLAESNCVLGANWTTNSSSSSDLQHLRSSMAGQGIVVHNISQYPLLTEGKVITSVSYAFWTIALINLPVPAAVFALMYHERLLPCFSSSPRLLDGDSLSNVSPTEESDQGHGSVFGCCNPAKLRGHPTTFFILHALGGAILFLTDGIIGSYSSYIYTYAVYPPLLMARTTAGYLNSTFWASITVGRLAFIYLSYRYTATRVLIFSLVGIILVQCLLFVFNTSFVVLFIGTCILGLCISSVFPSLLAFTEDILDYKGCATAVLVTSASTGEMMVQLLVGSMISSQGSYTFPLTCTIASLMSFGLFLLFLYAKHIHRKTGSSNNTVMEEKHKPGGS